jgi:hypothetical protein
MAAGMTDHAPLPDSISIAGISSDHTDAATITPDAKPSSDFCSRTDIPSRIMKTKAEPAIVPSSGISSPITNVIVIGCKGTKKFLQLARKFLFFPSNHLALSLFLYNFASSITKKHK